MMMRVGLLVPVFDAHHSETLQKYYGCLWMDNKVPRTLILWLANGSTSWISVFRALFITSYWLVCHAMNCGSNATDALIEDIRVEVLKFRMPSCKTYAEINCRMKVYIRTCLQAGRVTLVLGLPYQEGYPGTRIFLLIFNDAFTR